MISPTSFLTRVLTPGWFRVRLSAWLVPVRRAVFPFGFSAIPAALPVAGSDAQAVRAQSV